MRVGALRITLFVATESQSALGYTLTVVRCALLASLAEVGAEAAVQLRNLAPSLLLRIAPYIAQERWPKH